MFVSSAISSIVYNPPSHVNVLFAAAALERVMVAKAFSDIVLNE
jgi:hypothetical protein